MFNNYFKGFKPHLKVKPLFRTLIVSPFSLLVGQLLVIYRLRQA